ncbi:MAG: type II secretion system F family protein [Candidatus Nanopelagicales bacterium]
MSAAALLAGMLSALSVAGAALVLLAWTGQAPAWELRLPSRLSASGKRLLAALGIGLLCWVLVGWPVAGIGAFGATLGLPAMFMAGSRAARGIDQLEGLEEWTRRVADLLAVGFGLEQAIVTAAGSAPAAVAEPASRLAGQISARGATCNALRGYADQLGDPAADLVVAALLLADRRRGPGVPSALTAVAEAVGQEVAARRRVEADRAKPRTTARAVSLITLAILVAGLTTDTYSAPYGTASGQMALAAILAGFAGCLWWVHRMTATRAAGRLIAPREAQP